jgi:protein disulfide-isomerase A1
VAYGNDSYPIPSEYLSYASTARDSYLFGQYTAPFLPILPSSAQLPAIILYKSFDEGHAVYPASDLSSLTAEDLAEFVKVNSIPLMDEISPENFASYADQGLPIAYLFVDPEDRKTQETAVEAIKPLAKEYKGSINFVYIDAIKFIDHGKSLNLPGDVWPAFVIQDLAAQTKFPMTGQVTEATVGEFVKRWLDGEIPASIKSAPIPATQGPVYQLVADGWDALFDDEEKDVFAEFFAPWCGYCRK